MVMVMVVNSALVRTHQSTYSGSFGPVLPPGWIDYTRSAAVPLDALGLRASTGGDLDSAPWIRWILRLSSPMRGLSEYKIRAARSISPPGGLWWRLDPGGSVSTWILPSDQPGRRVEGSGGGLDSGGWILVCGRCVCGGAGRPDSGFWILETVGAVGLGVRAGSGDSGFWILESVGAVGLGVRAGARDSGFWILEPGLSTGRVDGCGGAGRPDSGFWILETGLSETVGDGF